MSRTEAEIVAFVTSYVAKQSEFDGDGMLGFWHAGGTMYLVGNQDVFSAATIEEQVGHIKEAREKVPGLRVEFVLDSIEHVAVQDELIASVHVRYTMHFPEGYGKHRCFYNMAKMSGKWGIVNAVDRGIQVTART